MRKNKIVAFAMLAVLAGFTIKGYADTVDVQGYPVEVDQNGDSIEYVEYDEYSENGTTKSSIYAVVASKFKVTIPKTVVLSGLTRTAEYAIDVDGDISGDEYILVSPDETFKLSSRNKDDIDGFVQQPKQKFRTYQYKNLLDDEANFIAEDEFVNDTQGLIFAKNMTAGKWQGSFNFDIKLV